MLATGCRSRPLPALPRSSSHISNCVSFENPSSTAPAFVPVAMWGEDGPGDHANVAVLGISRSPYILIIYAGPSIPQYKGKEMKGTSNSKSYGLWSKTSTMWSGSTFCFARSNVNI